jgi:RNA polymerase sigma-70 factor (ECF subfamily)
MQNQDGTEEDDPAGALWPAFADLYRRDYRSVVALVYGLSGNRWIAEDVAQDAFLSAHRHWDWIRTYDNPGAWVRHVAINAARSRRRKLANEMRSWLRLARSTTAPAPLPDDADHFWATLRSLPVRQAQALALHYYEDMSVARIAEVLRCGEATVKTHLHRGRQSLAAKLDHEDK